MAKVTLGGIPVTHKRTAHGWEARGKCPSGTKHSASGGKIEIADAGLVKHVAACNCNGCSVPEVATIAAEMSDLAFASVSTSQS